MPLLLALETATDAGGVALVEHAGRDAEPEVLDERALDTGQRHAATLLLALDALLQETGRKLDDVTGLALSIGPGSFTGLRIGLATAHGLCFGTSRRIAPVSTLAALSLHADAGTIAPLLDARRGQVYAGIYGPEGRALRDDAVLPPGDFLAALPAGPVTLLGSGALRYADEIRAALGDRATILDADAGTPRAGSVGRLGARIAAAGLALPPERVEPRYLRPFTRG